MTATNTQDGLVRLFNDSKNSYQKLPEHTHPWMALAAKDDVGRTKTAYSVKGDV